jgi:ABC-2 type transport system permease protein
MFAEFKHTLRRFRGRIIGWSIGLGLYGLMMSSFYGEVQAMGDQFLEMVKNYPEELIAFVGGNMALNTPSGYIGTYYFSMMSLIFGIFTVAAGAGLLARDEEEGILDLVLAHPISRLRLFAGRVLTLFIATLLILLVAWLGWFLADGVRLMDISALELLRPFLSLAAIVLFFGALALLFSLLLPASRLAAVAAGVLLVANYLLLGLGNLNQDLAPLLKYTPLYYYQGGDAVNGLNAGWLAGLLGGALLLTLAAALLFRRRDIRVGGERSWRLPALAGRLRGATA